MTWMRSIAPDSTNFLTESNAFGLSLSGTPDMSTKHILKDASTASNFCLITSQNATAPKPKTAGKSTIDHQFEEASFQARSLVLGLTVIKDDPDVDLDAASRKAIELFGGKWRDSFDEPIVFSKTEIRRYRNAQ